MSAVLQTQQQFVSYTQITCKRCGKTKITDARRQFCSTECWHVYRKGKRLPRRKGNQGRVRTCRLCLEVFQVQYPSTVKSFCSTEHRLKWVGMFRKHTVKYYAWKVEQLLERGYMLGEIAELLKFDRGTLSRFLKKNGGAHATEKKRTLRLSVSRSLAAIVVEVNPTFALELQRQISGIVESYNGIHQQYPALVRTVAPK